MTRATLYELKFSAMNSIRRIAKRWWGPALALMLCCAGLVVRAHSTLGPEARHASTLPAALRTVTQGAGPRQPARVIKFRLFEAGIYPREVHVDKGLVAITIEDYSGGTTGLVVAREAGSAPEHVGQVERAGPHWRGKSEVRLTPGRYLVYMADRPANRALLVVEP